MNVSSFTFNNVAINQVPVTLFTFNIDAAVLKSTFSQKTIRKASRARATEVRTRHTKTSVEYQQRSEDRGGGHLPACLVHLLVHLHSDSPVAV